MKLLSASLAFVAVVLLGVPASAGVVLANVDPTIIDSSASANGNTQATIDFVNNENFAVDVYWMDYGFQREFYQTLAAHSSYIQFTFITHPWLIAMAGSGDTTAHGTGTLVTGFASAVTPDPGWIGSSPDIANIGGVPEPAAWALLLSGFGLIGFALRRRRGMASFAA